MRTAVGEAEGGRWEQLRASALGDWAAAGLFVAVILFAGLLRAATIWPQSTGLDESPYDDEGVYAAAAQLLVEGRQPYRDFYYAHPPLGPMLLAPATTYHFTNWGSPTSFMMLRYEALLYSTLTVGIVFLIGWRLWGVVGGCVSGVLLALDPGSVFWVGRHVLLEGPYLFLTALAVLAYVLAREWQRPPPALLFFAGFFAAAAGGVKLQGALVLVAFVIDLLIRRRPELLLSIVGGIVVLVVPLAGYLFWLRDADPLGQFVWMQLLRPADGVRDLGARMAQLHTAMPFLLLAGLLAVLALPMLGAPARLERRRAQRDAAASALRRLPFDAFEGDLREGESSTSGRAQSTLSAVGATSRSAPATPTAGWTVLLPWTLIVVLGLLGARSYYAHYSVALSLPLALLAGVLPLATVRALRAGWFARGYGIALAVVGLALCLWLAPAAWRNDRTAEPDRLYTILGRYAGDAVGPSGAVFALDAQIPYRAARRPAREDENRFIVDGYGSLIYEGLGLKSLSLGQRVALLRVAPATDLYQIMWRPAVQATLRASMARSDLVVIDNKSDGRLTDETRQWLAANATLEERQERYVIYRIRR
jgi:hypothetical protein